MTDRILMNAKAENCSEKQSKAQKKKKNTRIFAEVDLKFASLFVLSGRDVGGWYDDANSSDSRIAMAIQRNRMSLQCPSSSIEEKKSPGFFF
jgi:hypothetical protein